jgi:hypothetical protein
MANTEETSAVCSDEIVFRYMYELAHLKWHDLCENEQEYQAVAYWGLIERQFVPRYPVVKGEELSLAEAMARLENLPAVMVSILTPRARWLVEYFGNLKYNDIQVRAGLKNGDMDVVQVRNLKSNSEDIIRID